MTTLIALPAYLVRVAGFAYARLEPLRCARSLEAVARTLDVAADARLAAGRIVDQAIEREAFPVTDALDRAARKQLVRHAQKVRAATRELAEIELPVESLAAIQSALPLLAPGLAVLVETHAAWRAASLTYTTAFAVELERTRGALRALYRDDARLLESVFLESPEAYVGVRQLVATEGARNSRARQRERLAMMYAQRFCAKNDTNSICGPLGVAYLDGTQSDTAVIEVTTEDLRRETYFSYWAAQSLLAAALRRAGEAAPITWRLQPTARVEGDAVAWCSMDHDATSVFRRRYARSPLPPAGVQLLRALASPHDAAALAALAPTLDLEVDELREFVGELTSAGILQTGPVLSPGLFYPLKALARELAAWPDSDARTWALGEVAAITELVEAFARAPLAERVDLFQVLSARFSAATGDAASRGEGKHYADRSVLHEDACIEVRSHLGPARAVLDRTLPSVLAAIELPLELARERVREWFADRFGRGTRIAVLEAHRAFDTDRVLETAATTPRSVALRRAIEGVRELFARAAATAGDRPVEITVAALAEAISVVELPRHPGYVSIDVMLRHRAGATPEVVLGEVHGFFWLPTSFLDILPEVERERVIGQMRDTVRAMAGPTPTAECLFLHTQATDRRYPLADSDLQLIVRGDREGGHDLGELEMRLVGDQFEFFHGDVEIIPLVAYTKYPFILYTSRIAPLFDDFAERFFPDSLVPEVLRGGDAPRIVVDSVVVRRRMWRRDAAWLRARLSSASEAELFRTAQAIRRELGCGSEVFISIAGEPKPLLLDFCNVFLLESIAKLVEPLPADAVLKISEMLPTGDELVASGPDGLRTSELRMGFYRTGSRVDTMIQR